MSKYLFSKSLDASFGNYLRKLREERDIPLRKVAAALDIDQSTLSKFERGERLPKEYLLSEIASYFDIELDEVKVNYLSEKIIQPLENEENPETILKFAEDKLKYIKQSKFQQGNIFNNE